MRALVGVKGRAADRGRAVTADVGAERFPVSTDAHNGGWGNL